MNWRSRTPRNESYDYCAACVLYGSRLADRTTRWDQTGLRSKDTASQEGSALVYRSRPAIDAIAVSSLSCRAGIRTGAEPYQCRRYGPALLAGKKVQQDFVKLADNAGDHQPQTSRNICATVPDGPDCQWKGGRLSASRPGTGVCWRSTRPGASRPNIAKLLQLPHQCFRARLIRADRGRESARPQGAPCQAEGSRRSRDRSQRLLQRTRLARGGQP